VFDDTWSPVGSVLPLIFVEHVDAQENLNEQPVSSSNVSPRPAHNATLDDTHVSTLEPHINTSHVDGEVSTMVQFVVPDGAVPEDVNSPSIVREEGMTHPNPRIQKDLDLWKKIKEYDQRATENPPVLSKKHKQMLK